MGLSGLGYFAMITHALIILLMEFTWVFNEYSGAATNSKCSGLGGSRFISVLPRAKVTALTTKRFLDSIQDVSFVAYMNILS